MQLVLFSEPIVWSGISVKEEIEESSENNEETGPSGIVVKEEIEIDEPGGIKKH